MPRTAAQNRGIQRERDLRKKLEAEGWLTQRAAGSLGVADVVAMKAGHEPLLIEVKSTTAGPFHSFGPADRTALLKAAEAAGARALLCWWPKGGKPQLILPSAWPGAPLGPRYRLVGFDVWQTRETAEAA